MSPNVPDAQPTPKDVEHLFGKGLLRFQAFEHLMKSVLHGHHVSGSVTQPEDALTQHSDGTRPKTMGVLVGEMMASLLVPEGHQGVQDRIDEPTGSGFSMLLQVALPSAEFTRIEAEHRALVALRNSLVHHFLEEHDLSTDTGRASACQTLLAAIDRVSQAHNELRGIALDIEAARKACAETLSTPEIRDWIATGRPPWHATTIVQALRCALAELAEAGWTSVDAAGKWIATHYPEETPDGYGCRTWQQVIHETKLFELQVRKKGGRRQSWYRARVPNPQPR